ncbi:MAG: MFS transporter [Cytophagaceae bacterium]|jgi:POT family proton-dependent oligopeptide transporter|nr:MFS transporter [Cytophagaceae bacterium]
MATIRTIPSLDSRLPSGIPYIIGNEAAERFSYYGMRTILTIFMVDYLRMTEHEATLWGHSFFSAVYFMPIFGALLADVFLGKYKTILSLSVVYCIGHGILALQETQNGLLWGLTFIAIGSGGIKPCASAHVGDQFGPNNKHLLDKVFGFFYIAINIGAFISSLATPLLLRAYGPSVAFGVPGALMLFATLIFWLGRYSFIHIPPFGKDYLKTLTSKEGLSAIGRLMFIYLFLSVFWALYDQNSTTWIFQAKSGLMDKVIHLGWIQFEILPDQIQLINPFLILFLIPVFTFIVYPWLDKKMGLPPLKKIIIGMVLGALSYVLIAYTEDQISKGIVMSVWWQIAAFVVITIAEILISVTALEFSYTQAPIQLKSSIMSIYLFSVSIGNFIVTGVNAYNSERAVVTSIETGNSTFIVMQENKSRTRGEKISIEHSKNVFFIDYKKDTFPLNGTFLVREVDTVQHRIELMNHNHEPIKSITTPNTTVEVKEVSFAKLKFGMYFYFYAALMLGTAFIFYFVAINYKEKTYIQGDLSNLP